MGNTNTLEQKIDTFGLKLDNLASIVGTSGAKLNDLASTVNALDVKLENLTSTVGVLSVKLDDLTSTVDGLAISVKNGFDQMVTKDEFEERMDGVNNRLDRIENISIGGHERRIDNLEDDIRLIKTKVGLK